MSARPGSGNRDWDLAGKEDVRGTERDIPGWISRLGGDGGSSLYERCGETLQARSERADRSQRVHGSGRGTSIF